MRLGTLAALLLLMLPIDSAAAHCYSVWRYPRPQHCHATALARAIRLPNAKINIALPAPRAPEIALPLLSDIVWGEPPDDELRGKLLLRVLLQAKESR